MKAEEYYRDYLDALSIYDRSMIAYDNPNNFRLIDRQAEIARMQLTSRIGNIMADAHYRVAAIIRGG